MQPIVDRKERTTPQVEVDGEKNTIEEFGILLGWEGLVDLREQSENETTVWSLREKGSEVRDPIDWQNCVRIEELLTPRGR